MNQENTTPITTNLGFPRVGLRRELKRAVEGYWKGRVERDDLLATARSLRQRHWTQQREAGIEHIPSNDFALYDHVLDAAITVGCIPPRYLAIEDELDRMFAMARGRQGEDSSLAALEMTKWFDTNYHYIVPEIAVGQSFELDARHILAAIEEARDLGIETRPVLLGPVSFLLLSKMTPGAPERAAPLDSLEELLPVYGELLHTLASAGVAWVQLDEPCLVTDLEETAVGAYRRAFSELAAIEDRPRVLLASYFGALGPHLNLAASSGLDALHVDLVRAPEQLDEVLTALRDAPEMLLSLGLVNGRNIWRADLDRAHEMTRKALAALGAQRVMVGPSCSLLHSPVDLDAEQELSDELRPWLAFGVQKLEEIRTIADIAPHAEPSDPRLEESRRAVASRRSSQSTRVPAVRARLSEVNEALLQRASAFTERARSQRELLQLPAFPTTTIGSFPQTRDIRRARADWRAGRLDDSEYEAFLQKETSACVELQETLGIDVIVHGEFERNDMVEYFGEMLEGFAFTQNGWVQSYGSRCVKPPILFGDVVRPEPMTVTWTSYAQSLTQRPVKGMLTGPVTMLQWSFVRDDQPRSETCRQLALAMRDEVRDLEAAGIRLIQVDEPAIREGLPLRSEDWPEYLTWAVECFRLATSGVRDDTQIHTHMCYSEFGDILDSIASMDADVLSIETSRSQMELLDDFARFEYPNEIGPGVYDIHSPRVPSEEEMYALLVRAAEVISPEQLWVNPDCGLKTRGWPEVKGALSGMVEAARRARRTLTSEV